MEALPRTNSQRKDGAHDEPYRFGRLPTAAAPFPFTYRQFARLMVLRSRLQDAQPGDKGLEPQASAPGEQA